MLHRSISLLTRAQECSACKCVFYAFNSFLKGYSSWTDRRRVMQYPPSSTHCNGGQTSHCHRVFHHVTGFPASGKIMEFEKSPQNLEKSWNLNKSTWKNHGILSLIWNFVNPTHDSEPDTNGGQMVRMYSVLVSWNVFGTCIMELDSIIRLETLMWSLDGVDNV